jgi:Cu(I)/Ag(I) efflux system membrane fusion protein
VSNLSSVWAVFDVYEQDISNFKLGQNISVKLNAYPDELIQSKINFIDPNLNTSTRTIAVRATLSNSKNKLKPGMFVTSSIELQNKLTKSNTVEIPKTAVLWTGKRSIVYVKTDENKPIFELREVELGNDLGNNYQIISGLQDGTEVVINGAFTVDAAAQLQGKNSMMNKKREDGSKKNDAKKVITKIEVNSKFKEQLNVVFQDYILIKDAFVLTDSKKVSRQAKQTLIDLEKVQMKHLKKPEAHTIWMQELPKIKASLEKIQQESDVEKQREIFMGLSNAMILLTNSFGVNNTIYVQHCPMANGNKGADWLSLEKNIRNPYYGDKMLTCGSVTQTVEK